MSIADNGQMKPFCRACQAIPALGYCTLSGCPMVPPSAPKGCPTCGVPEPDALVWCSEADCGCGLGDKCPDPPPSLTARSLVAQALVALQAMRRAFGDRMTRRALGGHNEQQQRAILAASAVIAKAVREAGR